MNKIGEFFARHLTASMFFILIILPVLVGAMFISFGDENWTNWVGAILMTFGGLFAFYVMFIGAHLPRKDSKYRLYYNDLSNKERFSFWPKYLFSRSFRETVHAYDGE